MANEDVRMTFDPSGFLGAMGKIGDAIAGVVGRIRGLGSKADDAVEKPIVNMSREMRGRGAESVGFFGKLMQSSLGGIAARIIPVIGAFFTLRSMLSKMPEVGQVFNIVGDIFMRNLMMPLRQYLMPYLQKLLDWVSDHRAMFVRWGGYLLSVFKIIESVVRGVIDIAKKLWDSLTETIKSVFGDTTATVSEMLNILIFKIAVVVEFMKILFGAFVRFFMSNIIEPAIRATKAFFGGFIEGFGQVSPVFQDMFSGLSDLYDAIADLVGLVGGGDGLTSVFSDFGRTVGAIVRTVLAVVAQVIDAIAAGIHGIGFAIRAVKSYLPGGGGSAERARIQQEMAAQDARFIRRAENRWGAVGSSWQAVASGVSPAGGSGHSPAAAGATVNNRPQISVNVQGGMTNPQTAEAVVRAILQQNIAGVAGAPGGGYVAPTSGQQYGVNLLGTGAHP